MGRLNAGCLIYLCVILAVLVISTYMTTYTDLTAAMRQSLKGNQSQTRESVQQENVATVTEAARKVSQFDAQLKEIENILKNQDQDVANSQEETKVSLFDRKLKEVQKILKSSHEDIKKSLEEKKQIGLFDERLRDIEKLISGGEQEVKATPEDKKKNPSLRSKNNSDRKSSENSTRS